MSVSPHQFRIGLATSRSHQDDAQIAELILDRNQCRRVLFLEDPHGARQHEADIQLLERAAPTVSDYALCISNENCGERWLDLLQKRVALRVG